MSYYEDPTGKVATPRADRRRALLIISGLGVLLVAAVVVAFLQHRQLVQLQHDSSRLIQAQLETIALANQQVAALDELATAVDGFNRQFGAEFGRVEMNDLEGSVQKLHLAHLPAEAKETLEEFKRNAADIAKMTAKMKEFERYLGAPVTAKRGESHADLARRYLVEQAGLQKKEAEEVLRRTALDWEIEPGNQVFSLYHDGILLTTVTQGSAKRSPVMVQWARRRAAQKKREALEARVAELEGKLSATLPPTPTGATAEPAASGTSSEPKQPLAPGTFWFKRADGSVTTETAKPLPPPEKKRP